MNLVFYFVIFFAVKSKSFFKKLLSGAAIGIASAIPGVSGGTIAVMLNVYDSIIFSISNLFKQFKKSFLYLLPIFLGIVLALIPCIYLFDKAFEGFVFGIVCLFAGLIIGSFPSLVKEIKTTKIKVSYIIIFILTLIFALSLGILSATLGDKINISEQFNSPDWWFYIVLIPVGALAATALVIPGISGSMFLLVLGFYKPLLNIVNETAKEIFNGNWSHFSTAISIISCFALGIIIGFFTIAKIMSFFLKNFKTATFFGILGFIVGSTLTLFFNYEIIEYYKNWANGKYVFMPMWVEILLGSLLLILGSVSSYFLSNMNNKNTNEVNNK